jgi:outer membrane protein
MIRSAKMKISTSIALSAITALLSGLGGAAQAQEQDNNTIRAGVYLVHYDAHAGDISGPYVPPGVNLNVDNVQTMYFAYVRRLSSHFDLELAGGVPPKTSTVGQGPAKLGSVPYAGQVVATSRWFSPSILLNYKFLEESSPIRPYVGRGVNYAHFYDNTSTSAGNAANGGPTSISLSDSFGAAATIGVSYRVQKHWSLNAAYAVSQVKSNMTANTSGAIRTTTIDFRPSAIVLSAGYSF